MEETLITICFFRPVSLWQSIVKINGQLEGVNHLILGRTWMDIAPQKINFCPGRAESFILEFPKGTAIHRIGKVHIKIFHIKLVSPDTDLLIRTKANPNLTVLDVWVLNQVLDSGHDFSNAGFIVRTKESCSICRDEGLPMVVVKLWEIFGV